MLFSAFNPICLQLSAEEYCHRYYIDGYGGHYNPAGNHFFAFAIKDALVEWLEPKPLTYQASDQIFRKREGGTTDSK